MLPFNNETLVKYTEDLNIHGLGSNQYPVM